MSSYGWLESPRVMQEALSEKRYCDAEKRPYRNHGPNYRHIVCYVTAYRSCPRPWFENLEHEDKDYSAICDHSEKERRC